MEFYDLKKVIETLFAKLRIRKYDFSQERHFAFHTMRCAKIKVDKDEIGFVGEIHPDVLENYQINKKVYAAELDIDVILSKASKKINFKPLPKFPTSDRDLAVVVKETVLASDVLSAMKETGGKLLEKAELFDVYQGGQIPKGYKSMAFSLTFRAKDRTLTDAKVNEIIEKIKTRLHDTFEANLRE